MIPLDVLHREVLYSQVRVSSSKGGGSGTVIASIPSANDYHTYVLSCHHVIDAAITVRKEWNPKLGREMKREYRQLLTVEFFDYTNVPHGHRPVNYSVDADLVAYDKDHDMAILKLRTVKPAEFVAPMCSAAEGKLMEVGAPVVAVGAALMHDPIVTFGAITHMGDEIDFKDYWMSSAQIIFGNSGGAMFAQLESGYKFLGIPSRVDVVGWGSAVSHLGYFSPIHRVYQFLDEQSLHFLIPGHAHTEADCEQELKKERSKPVAAEDEEEKAPVLAIAKDSYE